MGRISRHPIPRRLTKPTIDHADPSSSGPAEAPLTGRGSRRDVSEPPPPSLKWWAPSQGATYPVAASGRSTVTGKLAPLPGLHHGRRNAGHDRDGERYGHNG
jgi:hypothetical protein